MTTNEILNELKSRRTAQQTIAADAAREVQKLDAAIAALNGHDAPTGGPTVPDMVEQCGRELVKQYGPTLVITRANIAEKAREIFPSSVELIKRGFYNAVTSLKKRNKIKLAPGGFEVLP